MTEIAQHPLPALVEAGVLCSVSTDDPAMFKTNLEREYSLVASMGISLRDVFDAGVAGAQCGKSTKTRLADVADTYPWTDRQL